MTPTPEMIAMAERIGRSMDVDNIWSEARGRWLVNMTRGDIEAHMVQIAGERAALAAIMETSEKTARHHFEMTRKGMLIDGGDYRNGEHLK